jgi:glutamine amidotransferase
MCRWIAYSGAPLYLERLIFEPDHSLIDQSLSARSSETTTNGDGFGVGWYGERATPGVYKNTRPAWNDTNLRSITAHISSRMFVAHVRAATGAPVQDTNCHPFQHGRWLFVHNGVIEEFQRVKRELALAVAPELFPSIQGGTDSELMFFLALSFGLEEDPVGAMSEMVRFVESTARDAGIEDPLQMTVGLTDGERLYAFRYSTRKRSRTLYHSRSVVALRELNPAFEEFSDDALVVVSEPLNDLTDYWEEIAESSALVVEGATVSAMDFMPAQ